MGWLEDVISEVSFVNDQVMLQWDQAGLKMLLGQVNFVGGQVPLLWGGSAEDDVRADEFSGRAGTFTVGRQC